MNTRGKGSHDILIADDSEEDRLILRTSIERVPSLNIVAELANGTEVIAYLQGQGRFGDRTQFPIPDLLLLDLKMPFKDGYEVLAWLATQRHEQLVVVALTDSVQAEHIKRALDLGADFYQVKPGSDHDRHAMALAFAEYLRKAAARDPPPATGRRNPLKEADGAVD